MENELDSIKMNAFRLMFHDLSLNEKMILEDWVKKEVARALIFRGDDNATD